MPRNPDLAQAVRQAHAAYLECIAGPAARPWWTAVLVTAGSERQAERYRQEIRQRRDQQKIPLQARYMVIADPGERRVGSGGATLHALWRLSQDHGIDWRRDRVFLVHSGGDSRRLPQYSFAGKLFSELPVRTPWGDISTVFDETLALSSSWVERMDAGLLIGSGDVILTFDAQQLDWSGPGVRGVAMRQPLEAGAEHGVYVLDDTGRVYAFLQKPSAAHVRASGGLLDSGEVALDTGLLRLSGDLVRRLADLGSSTDWAREPEVSIDLYQHFTLALTGQWTPGPDDGRLLKGLAEAVRNEPFFCSLVDGDFVHVGTTAGFRRLLSGDTNFTQLYETQRRLGGVAPAGVERCAGMVIDSVVPGGDIGPGAIVLHCDLAYPVRVGRGSILHDLSDLPAPLDVPEDTVIHQTPVRLPDGRRGTVVQVYGVADDPKITLASGKATWFGRPILETLASLGLDCDSVWPETPLDSRCLWNANLFAFGAPEEAWAHACRLLGCPAPRSASSTGHERLSLEASARWADAGVLAEARSQRMQANWQAAALSLAKSGTDLRPLLAHAPGIASLASTGRALTAEAERIRDRAPTEAASLYFQASRFLRQAGLGAEAGRCEDVAFRAVEGAVEAGAGAAEFLSRPVEWSRDSVRVSAPARIDFGGGWSDTPPFCLDWGGTVLNAAVLLDSRYPISVAVKRLREPVIRLVSEETGESAEYAEASQLTAPLSPGSAFSIPRTALRMSGLLAGPALRETLNRAGGGLEIRQGVDLPMGSGLGTSSILAGALIRALAAMAGGQLSDGDLSDHVMRLEQLMTTGGGWQDQAGGIFPGAKLLRTGPGLRQRIRVCPVSWSAERQAEFSGRFLLYYTGIRRIARNLLRQVVGSYLAREAATVQVLHSIKTVAEEMAYALEIGDWDYLGSLLDRHWRLNQVLDPNVTNAPINALLDRLRPWLAGAKLAGAGGGGYLMLLAKDGAAAAELRRVLAEAPGGGRLSRFGIAARGMKIE